MATGSSTEGGEANRPGGQKRRTDAFNDHTLAGLKGTLVFVATQYDPGGGARDVLERRIQLGSCTRFEEGTMF